MAFVARFRKGSNTLDLTTGRYGLIEFVPPTTDIQPITAGGTSANRYGGAEKVSDRAVNGSFAFTIVVSGASDAECHRGIRDADRFVQQAGDRDEPLYLEWRPDNNVGVAPLWGQFGGWLAVEVVHGRATRTTQYNIKRARSIRQWATVDLQIAPFVFGQRQRLATASGGLSWDDIGTTGGGRGLIVAEATTNKMTNPVYSHATWNNGWSSDASLVVSQNTDANFLLPNTTSSAKITSRATGQEHYQSINVGNTNDHTLSCYARRPDGAAVTSSDVVLFYSAALATVFTSMGNGWYRLTWTGAGIASAQNTGAQIKNGRTVYLSGWQMEEKSYATPLCWGDLLGCAWSGTVHASTSTRTAGLVTVPVAADTFNLGEGTFRVVVRQNFASTDLGAGVMQLLHGGLGSFDMQYDGTNDIWRFSDGTNNSDFTDTTWAQHDIFVLHGVYQPGEVTIYVNAQAGATSATYTPPAAPSVISLGSTTTSGLHGNQTVMDFAIYDQGMTAAEVLADYNNIIQVVNDSQSLAPVSYLWNKDGDGIVDNCDDSTRDNWAVADGIPGTAPAVTEFDLARSYNSVNELLISNTVSGYFLPPGRTMFFDQSGTVNANSCGGEYLESITVGSGASFIGTGLTDQEYGVLAGKEVVAVARAAATASTYVFYPVFRYGSVSTSIISGESKNVTTTGTGNFFLYRTKPFVLPDRTYLFLDALSLDDTNEYYSITIGSGSATYQCDYFALVSAEQLFVIRPLVATASGTQSFYVKGERAMSHVSNVVEAVVRFDGKAIELTPGRVNLLMSFLGDDDDGPTITRTLTYNKVYITPRWSLR